ncbi:MAG: hypothetical protein ABIC91_01570 [Nanoarchaeota archaeon]|nr:hypothetical protein [Nanoarchaeota archaeon]MBU1031236.1 hypothetical protein [Nanoarchaeota archaeon]MBU1849537.1 hypothetical protein [Nanoarchaeota archaeon]
MMNGAWMFNIVVFVIFLVYFFYRKNNAIAALKLAWKSFKIILPLLLIIIILILFIDKVFSLEKVSSNLSSISGWKGYIAAVGLGSLFHIPHFIAFPIGGKLLSGGLNVGVIAAFLSSLIMVHLFTIPIEIRELGWKFAIVRNGLSLCFALIIGLFLGVIY